MPALAITVHGDFDHLEKFLKETQAGNYRKILSEYGRRGVDALSAATPVDSGVTAASWGYEIHQTKSGWELVFTNSNVNRGVNIAILLQYGHGTGTGGYVAGRDYINPALRSVFDDLANDAWKAVNNG